MPRSRTPYTNHAGVTREMVAQYQGSTPRCDLCGTADPGTSQGWNIDHDSAHGCPGRKKGCIECVRGVLCHPCNTFIVGGVEKALALGLLAHIEGPLRDYLDGNFFQRWRAQQEPAA